MNVIKAKNVDRCPTCGLSKDPETADLMHTRLGLDEPPEPLVCKCKPMNESIEIIMQKYTKGLSCVNLNVRTTMDTALRMNINTAMVTSLSRVPEVEVEARMNPEMSKIMYKAVEAGMYGNTTENKIVEKGCSWWTGPNPNMIAKLRSRNDTDMTAKMVVSACQIMPGITIAISYEYPFRGDIMRPEYTTKMTELKIMCTFEGIHVELITRKYQCEDAISYASEVEFRNGVTYRQMRTVLKSVVNTVGSITTLKRQIDPVFMSEIRYTDHDVVDVTDLNTHTGTIMHKADGMKMYVFCYASGYVIAQTDDNLSVISYVIANLEGPIYECTNKPDVLVAEMMVDGNLVYIDTLSMDGEVVPKPRKYVNTPMTRNSKPPMIMRRSWDKISDVPKNVSMSMESDGMVCVTPSRTLRLKKPTIDLMYSKGSMYASEMGKLVRISDGHKSMKQGSIYEMNVNKSADLNSIVISDPVRRLVKRRPNNMDIIRRALMSVLTDTTMSTILYDVTSMSFKMRRRTYEMAQATAFRSRKVIIIFGAGRFQEINDMKLDDFSYIAIDPNIDVTRLNKWKRTLRIVPYDRNSTLSKQIIAITKKPGNVIYYEGRSEDFIRQPDVAITMKSLGVPAVFSFSVSYHIMVINSLMSSGVSLYGCGFVHDKMPKKGVGIPPVSMNLVTSVGSRSFVRTEFGKSVYEEPILRMSSVKNLHMVKHVFPELWTDVDASTIEIMSRAVLMY